MTKPVWLYPADHWTREDLRLGPAHDELRRAVTARLEGAAPLL